MFKRFQPVLDIHEQLKADLIRLQQDSKSCVSLITGTIADLLSTNEEIEATIAKTQEVMKDLEDTKSQLTAEHAHNAKLAAKFQTFLED